MKKKATFSREQLSKSKTFGYGKDLVLAVLEDRDCIEGRGGEGDSGNT